MTDLILPVHEIFASVCGEFPFTGIPAVFLRLHGCNRTCAYCDTPQKTAPTNMLVYEVINTLLAQIPRANPGIPFMVTGGEPLLYLEALDALVAALRENYVQQSFGLETNGELIRTTQDLTSFNCCCVSPKLKSSGRASNLDYLKIVAAALNMDAPANLAFKFVLRSVDDVPDFVFEAARLAETGYKAPVAVQPAFGEVFMSQLFREIMHVAPLPLPVRFSSQMHKHERMP